MYNWQQSDWGKFKYSISGLEDTLYTFIEKSGHIKGLLQGLSKESQEATLIEMLVSEAIKTSEIENEYLYKMNHKPSHNYELNSSIFTL